MFLFRELMTNYIICVYKTSLTSPLFIEVPVPSQEIEWSCICMLLLSTLSLSMIFLLEFGPVSTEWYSFVFRFIDSFYRISIFITYLLQLLPCTLCSNKDFQDVHVYLLNKVSPHQHVPSG